jgi:hypothetical protein
MSIKDLNYLPEDEKLRVYSRLIPEALLEQLEIDRQTLCTADGSPGVRIISRAGASDARIRVPYSRRGGDYAMVLDLDEMSGFGALELAFIVVNDVDAPRFDIDVDEDGNPTMLGTATRNLAEEARALDAGLGPCQVRHGKRMFRCFLPLLEELAQQGGYTTIQLEPLTYHNAVMYERHGFGYMSGKSDMIETDEGFQPGGRYWERLDDSTPFRRRGSENNERLRSWAIHDGILGRPFPELLMYKKIGHHAGECNFHASAEPVAAS